MSSQANSRYEVDLDVVVRLRTAMTRLNRRLRQESLGILSPGQASTLAMITRLGAPTLGELARAEQMQPPTMTRIIAGMEALGLVRRETDPIDRRIARMTLTAKGARELERIRTLKTAFLVERFHMLDDIDPNQAEALVALLERIEVGE